MFVQAEPIAQVAAQHALMQHQLKDAVKCVIIVTLRLAVIAVMDML
jgi:hypothetical protein